MTEEEIPLILIELNRSAVQLINREQFEQALTLLQKAHGVLDVVDLQSGRRDEAHPLALFYNMGLCYQKLGQLEECSLCLETCFEYLRQGNQTQNMSAAYQLNLQRFETMLRLQLCAIYSQLHKHKAALE